MFCFPFSFSQERQKKKRRKIKANSVLDWVNYWQYNIHLNNNVYLVDTYLYLYIEILKSVLNRFFGTHHPFVFVLTGREY